MPRVILREFHFAGCGCSICARLKDDGVGSWGLLTPQDKVWNAWRWFFLVRRTGIAYLRWSGFWQRGPQM